MLHRSVNRRSKPQRKATTSAAASESIGAIWSALRARQKQASLRTRRCRSVRVRGTRRPEFKSPTRRRLPPRACWSGEDFGRLRSTSQAALTPAGTFWEEQERRRKFCAVRAHSIKLWSETGCTRSTAHTPGRNSLTGQYTRPMFRCFGPMMEPSFPVPGYSAS